MNKTIIININGTVFHFEEDAYEVLKAYMTDVKRHFAYSVDSTEIVTDIENRLAEMFNERLAADQKQVIVLQDVADVTGQMGSVNDFSTDDDEGIAGETYGAGKKLFRDIDERVIGGVCAGVAHYFGVEPRWMRLLAIVFLVTGGLGLPLYVVLWIVIPKAATRTDKMAMKGEPINIQSFKKNFDEEVESLKGGIHRAGNEARPFIYQIGKFIETIATLFIKFIIGLIAFTGIMAMIALFIALFTFLGYWNSNELNGFPFTLVNPAYKSVLTFSAFIIVFIPLAALVLFALRVLVPRIKVSKTVYFTMLIIWIAGAGLGIYHGSRIASEFNEEAEFSVTTPLQASPVYYLKINPVEFLTKDDSLRYNINAENFNGTLIRRNRDYNEPSSVQIEVVQGDVDKPTIIQEYSARGANFESALNTARRTKHTFFQKDSVLTFDGKTYPEKGELWRDQSVHIIIKVPINTRVMIEEGVYPYLVNHDKWECRNDNGHQDFVAEWRMTPDGLRCQLKPESSIDSLEVKPK